MGVLDTAVRNNPCTSRCELIAGCIFSILYSGLTLARIDPDFLFLFLSIPQYFIMHISQKLAQAKAEGKPTFSFEFFPPKTAQVRYTLVVAHESQYADLS